MSEPEVVSRLAEKPEPCTYCGKKTKVFFSYSPDAKPDICPDCFALTEQA